jgi:catechol 2,3-dioxygenase-like lactoylglutathione lyase family enzyme
MRVTDAYSAAVSVFNHVGHCVTDLDRSERFYVEVLGFTLDRTLDVPDKPSDRLIGVARPLNMNARYLSRDGFVLELMCFDRPGNPEWRPRVMNEPGLTHMSFSVDDIHATAAKAEEYGGQFLKDTDIGAALFIRDPDGQLIELLTMAYRDMI